MKTLFDKPLERRKVRESVAVDDASPPSHNNNTQQSSSKPPLLIQNLQLQRDRIRDWRVEKARSVCTGATAVSPDDASKRLCP